MLETLKANQVEQANKNNQSNETDCALEQEVCKSHDFWIRMGLLTSEIVPYCNTPYCPLL